MAKYNGKFIATKEMECPVCGNTVTAKAIKEVQKCPWCKRFYTARNWKQNGKWQWALDEAENPGMRDTGRRVQITRGPLEY